MLLSLVLTLATIPAAVLTVSPLTAEAAIANRYDGEFGEIYTAVRRDCGVDLRVDKAVEICEGAYYRAITVDGMVIAHQYYDTDIHPYGYVLGYVIVSDDGTERMINLSAAIEQIKNKLSPKVVGSSSTYNTIGFCLAGIRPGDKIMVRQNATSHSTRGARGEYIVSELCISQPYNGWIHVTRHKRAATVTVIITRNGHDYSQNIALR